MATPIIKIKTTTGQDISLNNNKYLNFRYIEDINLGFPTIEFALRDNLFTLLRLGLFGDEELIMEEFINDQFIFKNKSFKIKTIGSAGIKPKPASAQTLKFIAIEKNYDSILKSENSIYFLPNERKEISKLLEKLLNQVKIEETIDFKFNITPTIPLLDQGFGNLFIPYSCDALKVIRKLANYAIDNDGNGGFVFFINRRGLNFVPINTLFRKITDTTPYIQITDMTEDYGIKSLKLSTFDAFNNFITGHEKRIMGFNLLEKEYNTISYNPDATYIEYSEYENKKLKSANIKLMPTTLGTETKSIPFHKDFIKGNIKTYYTPLDNPKALKAFGDKLYYSQMFKYVLELNLNMTQKMPDFAIGEMVNVEFFTKDADKWVTLNGGWLLKSFCYTFPGDDIILELVRIGIGALPDKFTNLGEI